MIKLKEQSARWQFLCLKNVEQKGPSEDGEPPSSQPRHNKICLRHKHCHWVGYVATINPADRGEGSSLASSGGTTDKVVNARTSVAAAATSIADESCARAAAVQK